MAAVPLPVEIRLLRPTGRSQVVETLSGKPLLPEAGAVRIQADRGVDLRFTPAR